MSGVADKGTERTIAVGVDGSAHSRLALKWACDEAERRGSLLRIVFAGNNPPKQVPPWYALDPSGLSSGQAVVADAVGLVATRNPAVLPRGEVMVRTPVSVLTEASRSADLLVVGARGIGGIQGLFLGSVSEQCIRYSFCPVVAVPEGSDDLLEHWTSRIVVGLHGSFDGALALHWALEEGRIRSASVEAIYALRHPAVETRLPGPTRGLAAVGQELIDGAYAFRDQLAPDVPFRAVARFGPVVPSLLAESRGADLLVLGSGDHGTVGDAILGSVARRCARRARGPVVVVRPPVASVDSSLADAVGGTSVRSTGRLALSAPPAEGSWRRVVTS